MSAVAKKLNDIAGRAFGEAYYRQMLRLKLGVGRSAAPVLIWQMGKVGSSSVYQSIRRALPGTPIFHVHVLSDTLIRRGEVYKRALQEGTKAHLQNVALRKALLDTAGGRRWKIITLVREPMGRNLSSFFQNLDVHLDPSERELLRASRLPVETLAQVFLDRFDHDRPAVWFDLEIKGLLGIDVFAEGFPVERGYGTYSNGRFDLLLIRMEDLERVGTDAVREFLGASAFTLETTNVGDDKSYARLYGEMKRQIRFDAGMLDRIYDTRYARTFYSTDEISKLKIRWMR
jgi:hypothetical protein